MGLEATTITWYGHACVEVRTPGGKTILIDPWFGNPSSPKAAAEDLEQYRSSLEVAAETAPFKDKLPKAKIIWASSTPTRAASGSGRATSLRSCSASWAGCASPARSSAPTPARSRSPRWAIDRIDTLGRPSGV